MKKILISFLLLFISFIGVTQNQPGMVNKPQGGQTFNAEQYKIDRMKAAPKPNINMNTTATAPTQSNTSSSNYDAGAGYMKNRKEWNRKELALDYRKYSKKSKSKETQGLIFKYPDEQNVDVTHDLDGISAYNTTVFHNHQKEHDDYNNFQYDLYYSLPLTNTDSFGFGMQLIGHNSTFHECKDYTFFSFFITAGGKFYYLKKNIPSKLTSGFFGALEKNNPEMFALKNYESIPINAELKDVNLLTFTQWKNELKIAINDDVIFENKFSQCPVELDACPYNLFLNKGTVTFFEGSELYTEKKNL